MQAALTIGQLRPVPAPQLRLPAIPQASEEPYPFPDNTDLTFIPTPNGVLVSCNHLLVAWLFQGHAGRSKNNIAPCQFWDVSYPTYTTGQQNRITGMMLDSASFDSLAEAVAFVVATFGTEVRK